MTAAASGLTVSDLRGSVDADASAVEAMGVIVGDSAAAVWASLAEATLTC
jgi:hypothetical protein